MTKSRVGDLLQLKRERIIIEPEVHYSAIGIKSFGRGLIKYPPAPGRELTKLPFFKFPEGALAISNIKAWEGAFTLTSDKDVNAVASSRFLFYIPKTEAVDLKYLYYYFISEQGLRHIEDASPGSTDRNRTLSIKSFENLIISLPDISEQRRIATRLDQLLPISGDLSERSSAKDQRFLDMAIFGADQILDRWSTEMIPVGETCSIVNDLVRPGDDPSPATEFVGLEHIQPHLGVRIGSRPVGDEGGRKFRFAPGDILYGYLRPYLNKVWVADRPGLCSVEQFVLRPNGTMPAELIAQALRGRRTLDRVIALTNNLQLPRLRSGLLLALEIPLIRSHLHSAAVDDLTRFNSQVATLMELKSKQADLVSSLRPSLLNAAFSEQL